MPASPKTLLLDAGSSRIVSYTLSPGDVARLIKLRRARKDENGDLRVEPPQKFNEHPGRTRISSGGPLAALGMSQVYTIANERGHVHDFKKIWPEDLGCFHQATHPNGDW